MAQTNRAMNSNGRKVIYTDAAEITASNIADVLQSAMDIHESNRSDIQYLYDVYRGKHDILGRTKEIRPEILNNIVINYPYRIVRFKTGYNLGEPIQYIGRDVEEGDEVGQLNIYMEDLGKETADILLSDWCYIAGVGYRYANVDTLADEDMPPFKMTVLDPRYTFVAYDMSIEHKQKFCCTFTENEDGDRWSYVYTDTKFFTIDPDGNVSEETYIGAEQPIVEYRYNEARLGIFEVVMSIVNAIDTVTSNRIDGIEQFVQALLLFKGVNIDAEAYQQLKEEPELSCFLQKDNYSEVYWLSIYPKCATKAAAIQKIQKQLSCDRLVVFGDSVNDVSMCHIADESCAVANATEEMKDAATHVIGSNMEDSVAKWILAQWQEKGIG